MKTTTPRGGHPDLEVGVSRGAKTASNGGVTPALGRGFLGPGDHSKWCCFDPLLVTLVFGFTRRTAQS